MGGKKRGDEAREWRGSRRGQCENYGMYENKVWGAQVPDSDAEGKTEGGAGRGTMESSRNWEAETRGYGSEQHGSMGRGHADAKGLGGRTVAYARKGEGTQ